MHQTKSQNQLKRASHKPGPDSEPDPRAPEVPEPPVPPDMEPVIPQNDPPPGRPGDGQPPPIVA